MTPYCIKWPVINSLYGRIFAIFWLTMLMVLVAVLSLPHLDPRKVHHLPKKHYQKLVQLRDDINSQYQKETSLEKILWQLETKRRERHDPRPRIFFSDTQGNLLRVSKGHEFQLRAMQNFITSVENPQKPKQKLYGRFMIAGPIPITLANEELLMYVGFRWAQPPPMLIRLFDHPLQLLFAVMLVSTPFLLWLARALSQPARRLEAAAQRVARGEFVVDPTLERGTQEFREAGASFNQMVQAINLMILSQQRLLSDISHELRSPLTRLMMASALAKRKQGESAELSRIDNEAQKLESMIEELLNLSRMQVNSHQNRDKQFISQLWGGLLKDAQFEAQQVGKKLKHNLLPELYLVGNPKLLVSAVENVIRNALHYCNSEVEVSIEQQGNNLVLTVDDDGNGVPTNELEAIFRPFYRVGEARDRITGGTGLGLSISQNAIKQHNGNIQATKSPLGGLRVIITLPL